MRPSNETIRAIGAVIARAACFDDRVTEGDQARIVAWSEAVEPYNFDAPDLISAVTLHYQGTDETIKINNVIALARKIRGERAERENAEDLPELAPPDPQSMGLGLHTTGEPIWKAYEQHGAIDLPCETCGAEPEQGCVNLAINMSRRIPCVSRLTAGYRKNRGRR